MASDIGSREDKQLTCSICIGIYRSPRYLPTCGHTFCADCILAYARNIQQEQGSEGTKFQCPVCRKSISLPEDGDVSLQWVQTFPLNTVIVKMMNESQPQSSEESKRKTICEPCKEEGETNAGFKYCVDCKDVLCKACTKCHRNFKVTKGHKLVDIKDMPADLDNIDVLADIRRCDVHPNRDIEVFCKSHDAVLCYKCLFEHNGCDVVEIADCNTDNQKVQKDTEALIASMKSAVNHIDHIKCLRKESKSNLKEQLKTIKERIQQVRDQVVKLMDNVVVHISNVAKQLEVEREDNIDADMLKVSEIREFTQQNIAQLEAVQKHGSDRDRFVSAHLMRKRFDETNKQIREGDEGVKQLDAELIISETIRKLMEDTDVIKLAQIKVTESERYPGRFDCVSTQSNETGHDVNDLRDSKLLRAAEHTVTDGDVYGHTPRYTGASATKDGRVILSDYAIGGLLHLYNPADKLKLKLRLENVSEYSFSLGMAEDDPFSAVEIDDAHLAVSIPENKTINIVAVGNPLQVEKTFSTENEPRTIVALNNGMLAVAWCDPPAYSTIDISGTEIVQHVYMDQDSTGRKFKSLEYLAVDERRQHVIQPCHEDMAVHCFDLNGEPVFKYTNPGMTFPQGVALDRCGNIYVCEWKNNSIHKLSPTGDPISVITECVQPRPLAICCDATGTGFWVTCESSNQIVHFYLGQNQNQQ